MNSMRRARVVFEGGKMSATILFIRSANLIKYTGIDDSILSNGNNKNMAKELAIP